MPATVVTEVDRLRRENSRLRLGVDDLRRRIRSALYLVDQADVHAGPGRTAVLLADLRTVLESSRDLDPAEVPR